MANIDKTRYYLEPYQLAELYRRIDSASKSEGKTEPYLLWLFIKKCFPKLDLKQGTWRVRTDNILAPYIYNRKE